MRGCCFLWSVTRTIIFAMWCFLWSKICCVKKKMSVFHAVPSFYMSVCQNVVWELLFFSVQAIVYLVYAASSINKVCFVLRFTAYVGCSKFLVLLFVFFGIKIGQKHVCGKSKSRVQQINNFPVCQLSKKCAQITSLFFGVLCFC